MRRITVVAMFLAVGVALGSGSARAFGKDIPPGMMELTSQLLQKHPYLLSDQQREALGELNRKMREADRQLRKSENEAVRDKAADALDAAASRVIEVLQRCSRVIPVKIADGKARVTLSGPVMLPGDSGALLLQVESQGDGVRCVALMHDMSEQSRPIIPLDVGANGTTWALVGLTNVPAKRSSLRIDFKLGPERTIGLPVQVVTPPSGRLKVTVLSADSGQPTPAMIRLVCKTDGVDRPPSTAIEFAPQFDHQGKSTGRRPARYFGRLAAEFWCVPEPFDMVLPAGQWEIIIRRGVEHIPVFDTFTQVPVGFHPRGIGVLVPQAQADQADRIWQQRRDANAQRKTAESNLERSCRRTLFFSLGGCFVVGPLVVLTLFHIHGLSKRLTAEGESLSEDERGACARYLSNARVACIATSVIGTWIWVMLAYVLVMLASAA